MSQVKNTYKQFHTDLLAYKASIEEQRFADIQDTATKYYQAINQHDSDAEMIDKIFFTKEGDNYQIKLKLKNSSTVQDAVS